MEREVTKYKREQMLPSRTLIRTTIIIGPIAAYSIFAGVAGMIGCEMYKDIKENTQPTESSEVYESKFKK